MQMLTSEHPCDPKALPVPAGLFLLEPAMTNPDDPPDPVLAACAAFHAAFDFERHASPASDAERDRLADETDQAFARIVGSVPITPEAIAAKAAAAYTRLLWQSAPGTNTPWREQASLGEQAALECLAAMCGKTLP
jgi:hypothetical protein